jgi:DME family drug/metabolite transporter
VRGRTRAAVLLGAVGVAAYQLCFFTAVAAAGVAVGTIVAIGSAPALTGLLAVAVRRERPEPRWAAATALAVLGCVLLLVPVGAGAGPARPAGILLALGAGAAYGVYTLAAKAALDAGHPPTAVVAVLFGLGALPVAPLLVAGGRLSGASEVATVAYLGLVTVVVAYLLFGAGLRGLPPATVASLSLAEPLTAALLGTVVLGERLTPLGATGGLAIFGGLALLVTSRTASRQGERRAHRPRRPP